MSSDVELNVLQHIKSVSVNLTGKAPIIRPEAIWKVSFSFLEIPICYRALFGKYDSCFSCMPVKGYFESLRPGITTFLPLTRILDFEHHFHGLRDRVQERLGGLQPV